MAPTGGPGASVGEGASARGVRDGLSGKWEKRCWAERRAARWAGAACGAGRAGTREAGRVRRSGPRGKEGREGSGWLIPGLPGPERGEGSGPRGKNRLGWFGLGLGWV